MTSAGSRSPRPRRSLSPVDRFVAVPIGFLYLGVLAVLAVPVFLYMTALYWMVQAAAALVARFRPSRVARGEREQRIA